MKNANNYARGLPFLGALTVAALAFPVASADHEPTCGSADQQKGIGGKAQVNIWNSSDPHCRGATANLYPPVYCTSTGIDERVGDVYVVLLAGTDCETGVVYGPSF